jgi:predicted nuclease of predicted toxin-antitoxin system
MIIFDENIEEHWIQLTKNAGLEYYSIRENCAGITDREVIAIAKSKKGINCN